VSYRVMFSKRITPDTHEALTIDKVADEEVVTVILRYTKERGYTLENVCRTDGVDW